MNKDGRAKRGGEADGRAEWSGKSITVAGLGVSGPPVARALVARGADVLAVDARDDEARRTLAAELEADGVRVRLGDGETLPDRTDTVVTSPGWRPDTPLLAAAAKNGIPIIGDVELAWRLRPVLADDGTGQGGGRQRWLAVTGTNGKTTTVKMLEAMLLAAGRRAVAAGNVGTPLVDVVLAADPYDVVAVELSSFQLHWSQTLAPTAATVLNVAADHIDWHGSLEAYAADKGRVYAPGTLIVANADDAWSRDLAARAATPESRTAGPPAPPPPHRPRSARQYFSFTLKSPAPDQLGVVEDLLVDRAFVTDPSEAAELAGLADVQPAAPHNVANALAAAALARAEGVPPEAVRDGLRAFRPEPHRIGHVARVADVDYIDDSKATNPHAAAASLGAYPSIVWIAGGQLKGAEVDDLVADAAPRLRAVVALGTDRDVICEAVTRHAPNVPIVDVPGTDTGVMQRVVLEASRLARPGDTVLLAPAAASLDIFANYNARGDAFAEAVQTLGE